MTERTKPVVKLLKLVMIKPEHKARIETRDCTWPSEGLWQTIAAEEFTTTTGHFKRVFRIECIASLDSPHQVGDHRRIYESVLQCLYDEVELIRKPYPLPEHLKR